VTSLLTISLLSLVPTVTRACSNNCLGHRSLPHIPISCFVAKCSNVELGAFAGAHQTFYSIATGKHGRDRVSSSTDLHSGASASAIPGLRGHVLRAGRHSWLRAAVCGDVGVGVTPAPRVPAEQCRLIHFLVTAAHNHTIAGAHPSCFNWSSCVMFPYDQRTRGARFELLLPAFISFICSAQPKVSGSS